MRITTIIARTPTVVRVGWAATVRTMFAGHQQFQAEQDGLTELLAKVLVYVGLMAGELDDGDDGGDARADDKDSDAGAVDYFADPIDCVVEVHRSRPVWCSVRYAR